METCPLSGRRTAGEVFSRLDRLLELAHSTLILLPCMGALTEEERSNILSDFALARQHVVFYLRAKLGHWGLAQ